MLVSKPTHGGGAPLGIDLDAGVAKIKLTRPARPAESVEEPAAAAARTEEPVAAAAETTKEPGSTPAEAADRVDSSPESPTAH